MLVPFKKQPLRLLLMSGALLAGIHGMSAAADLSAEEFGISVAQSSTPSPRDPAGTTRLRPLTHMREPAPRRPDDPNLAAPNAGTTTDPAGNTPGTAPQRGTKPPRSVFYRLNVSCLEAGSRIRLIGRGFERLQKDQYSLTLKGGKVDRAITVLDWSEQEILAEIPKDYLFQTGKSYRLSFKIRGLTVAGDGNRTSYETCTASLAPEQRKAIPDPIIEGEILILLPQSFFNQAAVNRIKAELAAAGYQLLKESNLSGLGFQLLQMRIPGGIDERDVLVDLRNRYPQATIDYNHRNQLSGKPRTYADKLVGRDPSINACPVLTQASFPVGVIDGGVDLKHPALKGSQDIRSAGFAHGGKGLPKPSDHGTAIAVLFKGKEVDNGYSGLLPKAPLFVADILTQKTGKPFAATSSFLEGLNWLLGRKVKMVNMSLEGPPNATVNRALEAASKKNVYLFAAAGNGGSDADPPYPAAHKAVIGVTAVDKDKNIYRKATPGGHVDFSAPGVMLWLAKTGGKGSYRSGTSFAVPYVIANSAYFLSTQSDLVNAAGHKDLMTALSGNVVDLGEVGKDRVFGRGLIQFVGC